MNDQFSTVDRVAWHIAAALEPLRVMLTSEDAQREFVREELGIDAPDALRSMGVDLEAVDAVITALDNLSDALGARGAGSRRGRPPLGRARRGRGARRQQPGCSGHASV